MLEIVLLQGPSCSAQLSHYPPLQNPPPWPLRASSASSPALVPNGAAPMLVRPGPFSPFNSSHHPASAKEKSSSPNIQRLPQATGTEKGYSITQNNMTAQSGRLRGTQSCLLRTSREFLARLTRRNNNTTWGCTIAARSSWTRVLLSMIILLGVMIAMGQPYPKATWVPTSTQ